MGGMLRDKFGFPLPNEYIFPKNTKLSESYEFDISAKTIEVNEPDYKRIVLAINVDRGTVIYNPANSITNGTLTARGVILNSDLNDQTNNDELLVLYEYNETDYTGLLFDILDILQQQTKLLKKIYS